MDLRTLRRRVRRHPDLTRGAAQLFAEVCDLHQEALGCIAGDKWLARQLNTTPRTIRSWRQELRKLGVLRESSRDGQRRLIPQVSDAWNAQAEGAAGSKLPENRKQASGKPEADFRKKTSVRKQTSGQPENSFRKNSSDTENINTSLREEHEGGGARVGDGDPPAIQAFVDEVGRRPVIPGEYDEIVQAVDDVALFRKLCRQAYRNVRGDPHRVRLGYLLDDYESALEKQHAQSPEQDDRPDDADAGERAHGESAGGDHARYAGLIER